MRTMRIKDSANEVLRSLAVAALVLGLVGCAHPGPVPLFPEMTAEEFQAMTERAFQMERQADLVIDFETPNELRLLLKEQSDAVSTTEQGLAVAIAKANSKKDLAVVTLGKRVRYQYDEPELGKKVDEIEGVLKAQGFKKIVFQLASASGRPIYRE